MIEKGIGAPASEGQGENGLGPARARVQRTDAGDSKLQIDLRGVVRAGILSWQVPWAKPSLHVGMASIRGGRPRIMHVALTLERCACAENGSYQMPLNEDPELAPEPPVSVERFSVDWDCLEENPAREVRQIDHRGDRGAFFLNPRYRVTCKEPTAKFIAAARKAQADWCRTQSQVLGPANRRRQTKAANPLERQLIFTGMLIVDGQIISPRHWDTLEPWIFHGHPCAPAETTHAKAAVISTEAPLHSLLTDKSP